VDQDGPERASSPRHGEVDYLTRKIGDSPKPPLASEIEAFPNLAAEALSGPPVIRPGDQRRGRHQVRIARRTRP